MTKEKQYVDINPELDEILKLDTLKDVTNNYHAKDIINYSLIVIYALLLIAICWLLKINQVLLFVIALLITFILIVIRVLMLRPCFRSIDRNMTTQNRKLTEQLSELCKANKKLVDGLLKIVNYRIERKNNLNKEFSGYLNTVVAILGIGSMWAIVQKDLFTWVIQMKVKGLIVAFAALVLLLVILPVINWIFNKKGEIYSLQIIRDDLVAVKYQLNEEEHDNEKKLPELLKVSKFRLGKSVLFDKLFHGKG